MIETLRPQPHQQEASMADPESVPSALRKAISEAAYDCSELARLPLAALLYRVLLPGAH